MSSEPIDQPKDEEDVEMQESPPKKQVQMFDRQTLLDEFGGHITPVTITVGTYSSTLCSFIFPLIRSKDISKDTEHETLYPILSLKDFHNGSIDFIRTSMCNTFLFSSSGRDEKVNTFNMIRSKFSGIINVFEGDNSSMISFGGNDVHNDKYIMIGTSNGYICMYKYFAKKKGGFNLIWKKKIHKFMVNSMCVHESMRFILSVDMKSRLCIVNLMTGKRELEMQLKKRLSFMNFLSHNLILLCEDRKFLCYKFSFKSKQNDPMTLLSSVNYDAKITSVAIINEYSFIIGDDNRKMRIWHLLEGDSSAQLEMNHEITKVHCGRIKSIEVIEINIMEYMIVACSDEGGISIWRLKNDDLLVLQYFHDWNLRFLSLGVNFHIPIKKVIENEYCKAINKKDKMIDEGEESETEIETEEEEDEEEDNESEEEGDNESEEDEENK